MTSKRSNLYFDKFLLLIIKPLVLLQYPAASLNSCDFIQKIPQCDLRTGELVLRRSHETIHGTSATGAVIKLVFSQERFDFGQSEQSVSDRPNAHRLPEGEAIYSNLQQALLPLIPASGWENVDNTVIDLPFVIRHLADDAVKPVFQYVPLPEDIQVSHQKEDRALK